MTDRLEEIRADVEHAGGYISLTELGTPKHFLRNKAIERVRLLHAPYLLAEVERLRAAVDTEKEANVSESVCLCGHRKIDHIYEEGACRPGYVCALSCDEFTPVVGSALTEGGES